jgi:hypothetical protein
MITVTLTDREAIKLRKLLERRGNKDPDLARALYKIHHLLQRPAVKRRFNHVEPARPFVLGKEDE